MNIGFIGGGRVGKSFGRYLKDNDYNVVGFYSRSMKTTKEAAEATKSNAFQSLREIAEATDVIFITTPDDAIGEVATKLRETGGLKRGHLLVHMSGAHSSEILISGKTEGCYIASLHPLQAFADIDKAVADLSRTVFSIEGDCDAKEVLITMLQACGNKYFILSSQDKALYHGAACVFSNYLVTLMDLGIAMLNSAGIATEEGFDALYPLIEGSINNIRSLGTVKALTGPIVRGDVNTIHSHIEGLKDKLPSKLEFYKAMGRETTKVAQRGRLKDPEVIEELNILWKEESI